MPELVPGVGGGLQLDVKSGFRATFPAFKYIIYNLENMSFSVADPDLKCTHHVGFVNLVLFEKNNKMVRNQF